jgi:hypothetical protein
MRGLKSKETPILTGYQLFHNYIRPHEALDGKTPLEACGIQIEGPNKWKTMIQNASKSKNKQTTSYAYTNNLKNYAINLIADYNKTINEYFSDMKSSFYFYSNAYTVKIISSSQGRAAVWFEPANTTSYLGLNSTERLDIALFGGYPTVSGASFAFENGIAALSDSGSGYNNAIIVEGDNSEAILKNFTNVQIDSTTNYNYVVMKGGNQTNNWSADAAQKDADEIFYNDMRIEFTASEQIRQRYASYELDNYLQGMEEKFGSNSQAYPWSQWQADINYLENLATHNYHLSAPTGFLNDLIIYMNVRTGGNLPTIPPDNTSTTIPTSGVTPAPIIQPNTTKTDNYIFYYFLLLSTLPLLVFASLLFEVYYQSTTKPKDKKLLLGIYNGCLLFVLGTAVTSVLSNITIYVNWGWLPVGLILVGGFILIWKKRAFLISKAKNNSTSKAKAEKEADES